MGTHIKVKFLAEELCVALYKGINKYMFVIRFVYGILPFSFRALRSVNHILSDPPIIKC